MMRYIKRFALIGLLVGVFLIALQSPALAKAIRTDVTGVSDLINSQAMSRRSNSGNTSTGVIDRT